MMIFKVNVHNGFKILRTIGTVMSNWMSTKSATLDGNCMPVFTIDRINRVSLSVRRVTVILCTGI